ncbi:hypothetical protein U0070_007561 [Myodes glareolus]|uniref:60S ribosomal protein L23a n=1 Tax=Myodes glareolus TaxID=447135 RepID=A0AAW0J0E6_MYOGA
MEQKALPQHCGLVLQRLLAEAVEETAQISSKERTQEEQKFTSPLSLKKTEDNTLALAVNVKASKPQIKWAIKKLYDIDVTKVSTLKRHDREKKMYVWLAPDYDAPDVASKIGTI